MNRGCHWNTFSNLPLKQCARARCSVFPHHPEVSMIDRSAVHASVPQDSRDKPAQPLAGRLVLVVEDEYFLADDIASALRIQGAEIVGPIGDLSLAAEAVASRAIDGAVLDVNVRGQLIFPVARELQTRNIPFIFMTGYDRDAIPPEYQHFQRCEKPFDPVDLASRLAALILGVG